MAKKYGVSINESKPAESQGLTTFDANKRLEENGPNMLTPPKKKHWFFRFLDLLLGLFNLILIFCGIANYIAYAVAPTPEGVYMGIDILELMLATFLYAIFKLNFFV